MAVISLSPTTAAVVCTFNGASYIDAQLTSILGQTVLPTQIVISDDASTDSTFAQLEKFSVLAEQAGIRFSLFRNRHNIGYVENFRLALKAADADLLFLCDQDDIWKPDKIGRYVAEFQSRQELLMLHSDAELMDDSGKPLGKTLFEGFGISRAEQQLIHKGQAYGVFLRRNVATGATMAVRKTLIDAWDITPDGWIHDEWLAMLAALKGPVDVLEARTIFYRQHAHNEIGVPNHGLIARLRRKSGQHKRFMQAFYKRSAGLQAYVSAHLPSLDDGKKEEISARWRHAALRANLPLAFSRRLGAIFLEYRHGAYRKYSNGLSSALLDLFRPNA